MEWISISILIGIGIVLSAAVQIVRMGLAHEEKRMALKAGGGDTSRLMAIVAANEAEVARLRQRVEVLERLATDGDRNLANQINRLREDRV